MLVDAQTGQVLYGKNIDLPRPPASTTKIMTAILLLENTKPEDMITAPPGIEDVEGSCLNLISGEKVSAHDMLYALMLRSANDGCVAVANHIAGSEAKFAEMMTAKAHEIGALHTTFQNCNGLNDNPNVTTARDLVIMARYALRFPEFQRAVQSKTYTIQRSSGSKDVVLKNHAKVLWKFPGADGIKTGYTVPAGHCFVGSATWNGWRLISVVLHSPNIVQETERLMKYGFWQFERKTVAPAGSYHADAAVDSGAVPTVHATNRMPINYAVPKGSDLQAELRPHWNRLSAPIATGTEVGTVEVVQNGKVVCETPLVAESEVPRAAAVSAGALRNLPGPWLLCMVGLVVLRYAARATSKTARRRRSRFPAV